MSVRVVLREGEDVRRGLSRLRKEVNVRRRRKWTKRRFGYYEKPSELRRKRKKVEDRNRRFPEEYAERDWGPNVSFRQQYLRNGPFGIGR